jgi:predicted MPP superfamily phosphohydrolase
MPQAPVWLALALAALGHGFIWTALVNRLHGWGGPRRLIKGITILLVAAFAAIPVAIALRLQRHYSDGLNPVSPQTLEECYLWLSAAVGAASLVVKPWIEHRRYDRQVLVHWTCDTRDVVKALGRKPLVGPVARFLGNLPLNEVLTLSIDRKRLKLPGLPTGLQGLTIAHVTDLHMTGQLDKEFYAYVVRQVNDLRPDVIAITGDIIEDERCWPWLEETAGRLCAPLGVYFILGNHDALIDPQRTREILTDAGLTDVGGRHLRADWNGVAVSIIGNERPWFGSPEPSFSPPKSPHGFCLGLCHTPDQLGYCVKAGVDLALAGHTHGGQVQIPVLGVIASPSLHGTRYACGVFRCRSTVLHVGRGISGDTPLRWRCPPEIALLELGSL